MKQIFIHRNNKPQLTLFFAGWGMDENPFQTTFSEEDDVCICYDYTSLDFDTSLFQDYQSIRVIAWSFGVWVATQVLSHSQLPITSSLAINGTPFPIDDQRGIPVAIFNGTLSTLSERNLDKFNRRMCGSRQLKELFDERKPNRTFSSLQQELASFARYVEQASISSFQFEKAWISEADYIFPSENQKNAWIDTSIMLTDDPHFINEFIHGLQ